MTSTVGGGAGAAGAAGRAAAMRGAAGLAAGSGAPPTAVIGVSHGTGSWNGTACCMPGARRNPPVGGALGALGPDIDDTGFDVLRHRRERFAEVLERPCGRGLMLIRTFMDQVYHNESGNEITMLKRRG